MTNLKTFYNLSNSISQLWVHGEFFYPGNLAVTVNCAYMQAVENQKSSVIFTLEHTVTEIECWLVSIHSTHSKFKDQFPEFKGLEFNKIWDGGLNTQEFEFYHSVREDFRSSSNNYGEVMIVSGGSTVSKLEKQAEKLHSKTSCSTLYIGNVSLLESSRLVENENENERRNGVIRDLKRLAMSFNRGQGIAVACQLPIGPTFFRDAVKNGGLYDLTHLISTHEVERSADIVTTGMWEDSSNTVIYQCLKNGHYHPFESFSGKFENLFRKIQPESVTA